MSKTLKMFEKHTSNARKLELHDQNEQKISPSGNWTPVSRVTGGDTYHYTNEDDIVKSQKSWNLNAHEISHPRGRKNCTFVKPWTKDGTCFLNKREIREKKNKSLEPDSNQWPKDICNCFASTVLRSTNWAIEGSVLQLWEKYSVNLSILLSLVIYNPNYTMKKSCVNNQ